MSFNALRHARRLKRVASRGAERSFGFWLRTPPRARPNVDRWTSPGGKRVLVVAPHPDDEAVGCAGTMILHLRHGDEVVLAIATDGSASRAHGLAPESMARIRRREAIACAHAIGVTRFEWIGLPEGEWLTVALVGRLGGLLAEIRPDVVYAPSRVDFHPEHHHVAHALGVALQQQAAEGIAPLVRVYQVQVPLTPILVNLVTPTKNVVGAVHASIAAHRSQQRTIASTFRIRRYTARAHDVPGEAEAFWEMSSAAYSALHVSPSYPWPTTRFRGLRPYAFGDRVAYRAGARERLRLLEAVSRVDGRREAISSAG